MNSIVDYTIPESASSTAIEELELSLLIDVLRDYNGYDFSQYQRESLKRRVLALVKKESLNHISELIPKILHVEGYIQTFVNTITIGVTELFRDPQTFRAIQSNVFPLLHSYPNLKIWHAGCSTGEEVYSLSILLKENNLINKASIHATDINIANLDKAKESLSLHKITQEENNRYLEAGGLASIYDYFIEDDSQCMFNQKLMRHLSFNQHNLVHDGVFCEAQLILCRNVLIYFDIDLQNAVLRLFLNSLCRGGFLVLGEKESLLSSPVQKDFKVIDSDAKIYQKII